jgi:hypothetical protein
LQDDLESWLWENPEAPLAEVLEKDKTTRETMKELCKEFYEATEKDRLLIVRQYHILRLYSDDNKNYII